MMDKNNTLNPVWVRYTSLHIEDWLRWMRGVHLRSYVELTERFIDLNPHYIPTGKEENLSLLDNLLMDREFVESLSDTGIKVWADSSLIEFVRVLEIY